MNLDAMSFEELELLKGGVEEHPQQYALKLFPDRPAHYVRTARLLAMYACELITARQYREQGYVNDALLVEERCQAIYNQLPQYARW